MENVTFYQSLQQIAAFLCQHYEMEPKSEIWKLKSIYLSIYLSIFLSIYILHIYFTYKYFTYIIKVEQNKFYVQSGNKTLLELVTVELEKFCQKYKWKKEKMHYSKIGSLNFLVKKM